MLMLHFPSTHSTSCTCPIFDPPPLDAQIRIILMYSQLCPWKTEESAPPYSSYPDFYSYPDYWTQPEPLPLPARKPSSRRPVSAYMGSRQLKAPSAQATTMYGSTKNLTRCSDKEGQIGGYGSVQIRRKKYSEGDLQGAGQGETRANTRPAVSICRKISVERARSKQMGGSSLLSKKNRQGNIRDGFQNKFAQGNHIVSKFYSHRNIQPGIGLKGNALNLKQAPKQKSTFPLKKIGFVYFNQPFLNGLA